MNIYQIRYNIDLSIVPIKYAHTSYSLFHVIKNTDASLRTDIIHWIDEWHNVEQVGKILFLKGINIAPNSTIEIDEEIYNLLVKYV